MALVGDTIVASNANWSFGGEVSKAFDAHVVKSVPLYRQGHEIVTQISDFFLYNGALAYELGCSTGELIRKIAERNIEKSIRIIGIDREPGMVEQAREKCSTLGNVKICVADLVTSISTPQTSSSLTTLCSLSGPDSARWYSIVSTTRSIGAADSCSSRRCGHPMRASRT